MELDINEITDELLDELMQLRPETDDMGYGVVQNQSYDPNGIADGKYSGGGLSIDYSCCDKQYRPVIGRLLCSLGDIISQLKVDAVEAAKDVEADV